jgi:predicted nucleotidyltransferase
LFKRLLAEVATILEDADIPYMVIGGQAVLLYGEPRMTRDIDVTLGVDIDRIDTVLAAFEASSFRPLPESVRSFVTETHVLPMEDASTRIRLDLIFSFSPYEREALSRVRKIDIDSVLVRFASPEDVVIHKLVAGRPRDVEDVRHILSMQEKIDDKYIRGWLKQFDTALDRELVKQFNEIMAMQK